MARASQVTDLMNRMMKVDVFEPLEKLRMARDQERTFLDPNLIMDARHRILREDLSVSPTKSSVFAEAKRLLAQEEETQSFMKKQQRFLERELRRFETEVLRSRPKFSGPYTCKKGSFAPSDDEEFWGACKRSRRKSTTTLKRIVSEESTERSCSLGTMDSARKDSDATTEVDGCSSRVQRNYGPETTERELSLVGNIKVMITDKPSSEIELHRRFGVLKKCFDVLRVNAEEERRLREIRTKIQGRVTSRLMRKYFDAWRMHATTSKTSEKPEEEAGVSDERKIELFIHAITERQRELMKSRKSRSREDGVVAREITGTVSRRKSVSRAVVVESPAQSRLIAQKRIIEDQRAKLAEKNRIIEELRLKEAQKEIYKAGRETVDMAKETLTLCGKMTRRTLIHLMQQAGYRDESMTVPHKAPDPPKFLSRMEARAEARRERMRLVDESRRIRLEEQKRQEEAARAEEEQTRKRLQQEAAAEARRLRREQEQNRLREIERQKRLNNIADQFHRRYLLRRYLIDPLTSLVEQKKSNARKADDWYRRSLIGRTFVVWRTVTETERETRIAIAESFYQRSLVMSAFGEWKRMAKEVNSKHQVATDFCDMKLLDRYFGSWRTVTLELKAERKRNEELADGHCEQRLKARYFHTWRKYLAIAADIAETEKRKEELRQLVQTVIPDFDPRLRNVALED
ncbi:uncharacterized protein LOC143217344 [Lasioglossum baleicum]|uniref:uncharacterized protein LOC143217344 n=1 Tax=Lasioglossum baleicum TaxID=434251 RepID=UPI003FCDEFFB